MTEFENENVNPFQAPETASDGSAAGPDGWGIVLATRGGRLGAALIDSLIGLITTLPLFIALGVFEGMANPNSAGAPMSFGTQLILSVVAFGVYLLIHGYLIATNGQTVGKRLVGVKMVRPDGSPAEFSRIVLRRVLPIWIVAQIPFVGNILTLIDVLFIFGKARRCVHDLIADTIVVRC